MDKREETLRKVRSIVALILVALYVLGLVAMLASRVQLGLILWVVSTLGGIGLLYWIRQQRERKEAEEKARQAEQPQKEP